MPRRWIWLGVGVLIAFWVLLNIGVWFNHAFLDCAHHPPPASLVLTPPYRMPLASPASSHPRDPLWPLGHGGWLGWLGWLLGPL